MQAIGIDLVDLDRFAAIAARRGARFLERILTPREIAYCHGKVNGTESMAARFAAKEAMIKCLPVTEHLTFRWHEMEVLNDESGKPRVLLHGQLAHWLENQEVLISLSHSRRSAVALVMVQDKERNRRKE